MSMATIPTPSAAPPDAGTRTRRIALKLALVLGTLLTIPVVALFVVEGSVIAGCTTVDTRTGIAEGNIAWRIQTLRCRGSERPYYDVAFGAKDKTMATALTSFGSPVPLEVKRLPDGRVGVVIDRPWPSDHGLTTVPIAVRRSGTPAERIDLQATGTPSGPRSATTGPRPRM